MVLSVWEVVKEGIREKFVMIPITNSMVGWNRSYVDVITA